MEIRDSIIQHNKYVEGSIFFNFWKFLENKSMGTTIKYGIKF